MKIKLLCFLIALCSFLTTHAQRYNLAIGGGLNVPSGNSSNISAIGFGGGLKAEIGLSKKFALTANGNVDSFIGKTYFGYRTQTITSVPVKMGFKYYRGNDFYFEGQLGAAVPLNTANAKTSLVWSLGLGSYIKSKNSENALDLGLRYEAWVNSRISNSASSNYTSFNFIALRVAYAFSL